MIPSRLRSCPTGRLVSVPILLAVAFLLSLARPAAAQEDRLQSLIYGWAPEATWAAIPIDCWSYSSDKNVPPTEEVVGTGFLINDSGYFITAGHVATTTHVGPADHPVPCQVKALLRQRDGSGFSQSFDLTELDSDHDLALCHIAGFAIHELRRDHAPAHVPQAPATLRPFASVALDTGKVRVGQLCLLSGYPLGSNSPDLQLGMVSATVTRIPGIYRTPKDGSDLLQVTVNGNHGDSGAPLMDLTTGRVVGVILEFVPAPIAIGGTLRFDIGNYQSSGIMLAAPAAWVNALLARHHLASAAEPPGRFFIW